MIEERIVHGRARRHGTVVCHRVRAVLRTDGLRRHVCVRFIAGLDPALREELERLRDTRGGHGRMLAETLAPLDLELRSLRGSEHLEGCRLGPPIRRFAPVEHIDFRVRT